jgi:threonine dehydrogenase-like Zn-dependent dehydrogenase
MRALQLQAGNRLVEVSLPVPRPKPGELLIRTVSTTICTSDLNDIAQNPFAIALPRVLGHEAAGYVVVLGENSAAFQIGDPVAAHPVIPCHQCDNCRRGLAHLCSRMGHLGLDRDGTFAEYFCIPAERVRRVPAGMPLKTASLLEPVAVCLEAVERGRTRRDNAVLIVGDGPFGIIIARLAAGLQPRKLILVGRHDFRLAQVPEAVRLHENKVTDVHHAVLSANDGNGVDVAIMAAGTQSALDLCLGSLRARGRAVVFSAIKERASIDLFRVHTHELEIAGACNDLDLLDSALERLNDPRLQLASLITHHLPFAQWSQAFDLARHAREEALKVALTFGEDA